jgi:BirA family biotin operon repressor/biotin-[acetyl-CoA-carboxylase] ligase
MDFSESATLARRFEYLAEVASTNDELVRRATGADARGWPDLSVIVTDNQTGGRGRLGRTWTAPAGKSLAISVLLRPASQPPAGPQPLAGEVAPPSLPMEAFAWLPLLAGLAMTRAVASVVPGTALKWPNDVLVGGRKVCGILCELLPNGTGVVVGSGLNVALEEADLPTDTSTSLLLAARTSARDATVDADAVLASYLRHLTALYGSYRQAAGDPEASGLLAAVTERCESLGRSVRVELPSGERLLGEAAGIDVHGRLVVKTNTGVTAVAAGDVTHLRY